MKANLLRVLVVVSSMSLGQLAYAAGPSDSLCGKHLNKRSVMEVLQDHAAAVQSGNAALVACDYDANAVLIMPNAVIQGQDQIQAFYAQNFSLAGGPLIINATSLTIADDVVLIEYTVSSPNIVLNDNVDTFVIDKGLINAQSVRLH
jgi:hypothetical protein